MATIQDLDTCHLFARSETLPIAIGWLGKGSDFGKGPVEEGLFRRLCELCAAPWQPAVSAGVHRCELCQFDPPVFSGCVFVPNLGRIFVAPVGIVHYVSTHWYRPPEVFVDAVLVCPPMRSMEYKKALLAGGGRTLVRPATDGAGV